MEEKRFLNRISVKGLVYELTSFYDTELDENSTNAVQNKVVTETINDLRETKADQSSLDDTNEALEGLREETNTALNDLSSNLETTNETLDTFKSATEDAISSLESTKADQSSLDNIDGVLETFKSETEETLATLSNTKANQSSLEDTNEALETFISSTESALSNLDGKVSNIIPIGINEINSLFGL